MTDTEDLKHKFWTALAASPYLFLQRDDASSDAVPMTAVLDKKANHAIWFFTSRTHHLSAGGPATATFAGKGHDLFARFRGTLSEETSQERIDSEWNNFVEAYFPEGKDDPDMVMLRMDLGQAELWNADLGLTTTIKMALGRDVRDEARQEHAETAL